MNPCPFSLSTKPADYLGILLLICLFGCRNPAPERPERAGVVKLVLNAQKEEFGSFGFLSGSQGMDWAAGTLYFSDAENSRVLALDRDLKAAFQVGKPGEGPSELSLAGP